MSSLFCNACNMENDPDSIKCEQCKSILSIENTNCILKTELENDFLDIDEAEMKEKIIKLENLNEIDKIELGIETNNVKLEQAIKEEPEFHIEPDIELEEEENDTADYKKEDVYECTECNKCFKRKASLMSHKKAAHIASDSESEQQSESEHEPELYAESFPQSKNTSSKLIDESTESIPSILILKCNLCHESFANINKLKAHQNQCKTKEKFHCKVCNIFLSCNAALRKHEQSRQHNSILNNPNREENCKYVCVYCGEKFLIQIALTKHKKVHLNEMAAGQPKYFYCKICKTSSTNKKCSAKHITMQMNKKPFICKICGMGYTSNSYLTVHMKLHSDERPFKCSICGTTYRHLRSLRKHLFRHTGQRPFECKYCGRTFTLKDPFNDHVRLKHTGETPYECEICQKAFKTSYLLNVHRRVSNANRLFYVT
ncbi:zinc finger protein OZF-like isoform X4 [Episyrphus balteatus]|uniref:zinc finger protein OZF-like isoform X4 n=1 Tax=Episyrphus balteatus TaxID=286459 RepID=UPI002484E74F|nr:zinc finger protein OZF-like isoform X4 [Episyrphus balteatus]